MKDHTANAVRTAVDSAITRTVHESFKESVADELQCSLRAFMSNDVKPLITQAAVDIQDKIMEALRPQLTQIQNTLNLLLQNCGPRRTVRAQPAEPAIATTTLSMS